MKKQIYLSLLLVLMLSVVFFSVQQAVSAYSPPPPPPPPPAPVDTGPANGDWVATDEDATGSEIATASITADPPNEWSELKSKGFVVSGRTEICHPFRGGQFGWHTSIYLLNGSTWIEIPTTVEWYPDEEGQLMACAYAPVSGTYAMFGYWEWFEGFQTPEPEPTLPPRPDHHEWAY